VLTITNVQYITIGMFQQHYTVNFYYQGNQTNQIKFISVV